MNVVGLVGHKGSGKSVAAEALLGAGFTRLKFADPLKDMVRQLLFASGLDHESVERMIEGDLKEVPAAELNGKTPRYAMQTLGTEWGRQLIGETFWVDAWRRRARGSIFAGHRVVADDVRFQNEADAVLSLGGVLIRIERPGIVVDAQHPSERSIAGIECRYNVINGAGIDELRGAISRIIREESWARKAGRL